MQAISEALSVLSSDDAHDLFTRTFNPALVEEQATKRADRRARASSLLAAAGRQHHNPRLMAIAAGVRLDAFERVKKATVDMVTQFLKYSDETKHKDFCVGELNTNQLQTEKKERDKQDIGARMEDLTLRIESLGEAVTGLKAEIAEMQLLKRAGEDREMENKDFQTTVADQRETQKLLTKALAVLKEGLGPVLLRSAFPQPHGHLEESPGAGPPPPQGPTLLQSGGRPEGAAGPAPGRCAACSPEVASPEACGAPKQAEQRLQHGPGVASLPARSGGELGRRGGRSHEGLGVASQLPPPPPRSALPQPQGSSEKSPGVGPPPPQARCAPKRAKQPQRHGTKRRSCNFVFLAARGGLAAFGLVPRILGPGGQRMRSIAAACDGKVRIRGKGSGYLEGREHKEANLPLQIALSCSCDEDLNTGREMLTSLLDSISDSFANHCREQGVSPPRHFYWIVEP